MPFEQSFRGGVSVAVGDLVGDSTPDIAVAAASNGGPRVAIIDGATGKTVENFFVYEPTFRGGVSVAIGDINGDGKNDLITGTGTGGAPRVTVIDVATGNTIQNFFAFESSFRGGVNVSAADVNGDGVDDVVVGTGVGGAPRVTAFSGDDTGNIPDPKSATGKCELSVAKAVSKAVGCVIKCHASRASGKLADDTAEDACEKNNAGKSCLEKFQASVTKAQGADTSGGCNCISGTTLAGTIESQLDVNTALVYCGSPSGAFLD